MTLLSRERIKKACNAMIITFAFAALCHLLLVSVVALAKRNLSYLNPLDFLGVSILLPEYRNSRTVAGFGWLTLGVLFFLVLYIRAHYHIYVAVMRESRVGVKVVDTTRKMRAVTTKLAGKPKDR